jgi:hypothetical protein
MINDAASHPRTGPLGLWDRVAGPGADPMETGLVLGAVIAGPGLAIAWARAAGADWAWWQWLVMALIACQLAGGLASNALPAARRWRHRPAQGARAHFAVCTLHIHPLVLALAAPDALSLREGLLVYGLLLAGAGLVLASPTKLRKAVGLLASAVAIVACGLWIHIASPAGWVPAVLYLSLLAGYLVPPVEPPVPEGPWS